MTGIRVLCPIPLRAFIPVRFCPGDYTLIPPVYIGRDVTIGDRAVIGPNSVIDDGCNIGAGEGQVVGGLKFGTQCKERISQFLGCLRCGYKAVQGFLKILSWAQMPLSANAIIRIMSASGLKSRWATVRVADNVGRQY